MYTAQFIIQVETLHPQMKCLSLTTTTLHYKVHSHMITNIHSIIMNEIIFLKSTTSWKDTEEEESLYYHSCIYIYKYLYYYM